MLVNFLKAVACGRDYPLWLERCVPPVKCGRAEQVVGRMDDLVCCCHASGRARWTVHPISSLAVLIGTEVQQMSPDRWMVAIQQRKEVTVWYQHRTIYVDENYRKKYQLEEYNFFFKKIHVQTQIIEGVGNTLFRCRAPDIYERDAKIFGPAYVSDVWRNYWELFLFLTQTTKPGDIFGVSLITW